MKNNLRNLVSKLRLKDLKTALRVLGTLDTEVPREVFIEISQRIRNKETANEERRMKNMSEEELVRHENRTRRILRVNTLDGRILQERTNDATFLLALQEAGKDQLNAIEHLVVRNHPLFIHDLSGKRKRITNYKMIQSGLFVFNKTKTSEKLYILKQLDSQLQLNWDIQLI